MCKALGSIRSDPIAEHHRDLAPFKATWGLWVAVVGRRFDHARVEPLRDFCAALPAEVDAANLAEARQLLSH